MHRGQGVYSLIYGMQGSHLNMYINLCPEQLRAAAVDVTMWLYSWAGRRGNRAPPPPEINF